MSDEILVSAPSFANSINIEEAGHRLLDTMETHAPLKLNNLPLEVMLGRLPTYHTHYLIIE